MDRRQLDFDGFTVLPSVYSAADVDVFLANLDDVFAADSAGFAMRTANGSVYGARNILQIWPAAAEIWRRPPLPELLTEILGANFGLVRVLYFDKPPDASWALPWHQDKTIAVRDNRLPSDRFSKPTFKAGVPHVEAPVWLMERMLTLRLHLDDMTDDNGPLKVLPGSHRGDDGQTPVTILGPRGSVLAMRPLLSHCSNKSRDQGLHRRVLHYEFAGDAQLPDHYDWHDFVQDRP